MVQIIVAAAEVKGAGEWTTEAFLNLAVVGNTVAEAVYAKFVYFGGGQAQAGASLSFGVLPERMDRMYRR